MKKYVKASRSRNRAIIDKADRLGDELADFLAEHTSELADGILSEEEIDQIGEVSDMLHDVVQILVGADFTEYMRRWSV